MHRFFIAFLILSLSAGCGDDDTAPVDTGTGDAATDTGTEDTGPIDNGIAGDEVFSGECVDRTRCGERQIESACTCLDEPRESESFEINRVGCEELGASGEGVVRTPEDDFCDDGGADGAPIVDCNLEGSYRVAGESQRVTVYGVVDVFGNGADANNITVEIFEENADGTLGAMLGTTTATTDDPCSETETEIENDLPVGERQLGFYFLENIPTERPLVIHTSGNASFWKDIYAFNVVILNEELETDAPAGDACETFGATPALQGARWENRPRILSSSDWNSIPLTAGVVEGVRPSSGVVAGEIHDCADVRLEFAQVATNPTAIVTTYFNDNPDNPLPETTRRDGTSLLGLYAAIDIPEGPVDVAAMGRLDGELTTLGWYRAQVFAGAVTTITLRGLRSHQLNE